MIDHTAVNISDQEAAKAFYSKVFELPVHYQDEASCVFDFGNTLVPVSAAGLRGVVADIESLTDNLVAQGAAAEPLTNTISSLNDARTHRLRQDGGSRALWRRERRARGGKQLHPPASVACI